MGIQLTNGEVAMIILIALLLLSIVGFIFGFLAHWILKSFHRSWVWGVRGAALCLILGIVALIVAYMMW